MSPRPVVLIVDARSRHLYEEAATALGFLLSERSAPSAQPQPSVRVRWSGINPRMPWVASMIVAGKVIYRYGSSADEAQRRLIKASKLA